MAARTRTLLGVSLEVLLGVRGLLVGVAFLGAGLAGFPPLALVSVVSPAVSGVWLVVPLLLGVAGLGVVGRWVVLVEEVLSVRALAQPAIRSAVWPVVQAVLHERDRSELPDAGELGAPTSHR